MKKIGLSIAGIIAFVLLGVTIVIYATEDKEGPEITFTTSEFTYIEGSDTKELLQGVTATDAIDGNVSDTLIIESIIPLRDNTTAKVIYAAKDRENHITKSDLIVNYIVKEPNAIDNLEDAEEGAGETVEQPEPTEVTVTPTPEVVEAAATATDPVLPSNQENNNSSESIVDTTEEATVENTEEATVENTEEAVEEVTSDTPEANIEEPSEEEQRTEEQGAEEVAQVEAPVITLTEQEVYLKKGQKFDPLQYIASIQDDKDSLEELYTRILIEGVYNRNKVGTYILEYYVKDSEMKQSESVYLKLYVRD
ncbi:MAG: hypothetical protein K0S47_3857 [Herbinix sp.]|jgi:hypothetical protein|nr:hypothetical protein [Herbinix sp.]